MRLHILLKNNNNIQIKLDKIILTSGPELRGACKI